MDNRTARKRRIEETNSRTISNQRANELAKYNAPFEAARKSIVKGTDGAFIQRYQEQKAKLLALFGATGEDWDNWRWQFKNRVEDADVLAGILGLDSRTVSEIKTVGDQYRWAITPYYLALIDPMDARDPIRLMSVPSPEELDSAGEPDPMDEEHTNPAGAITRRYPDRLIINVTNACAMFCRHCQRRRRIGERDMDSRAGLIDESIDYIAAHPEIRDVLITGGDALALSDTMLESIISRLRAIPHVEIIRLGTRMVVTLPQRVTPEFVAMLKKYHPVYINVQFNHPQEMTPEAKKACGMLADAGVPLGNQMVLLDGVNNDKYVVRVLNHELLKARVRPYYIFHAKQVIGTRHFQTSVDDGIDIMEHLRGHTSGMAIPTYIINAPGGRGKTPILPQYILEKDEKTITLRTWEGEILKYPNKH